MSEAIKIMMHLGEIIQALKDLEHAVVDVVQGKASSADAEKVLSDLQALVSSGLISIPGISDSQIVAALASLKSAV